MRGMDGRVPFYGRKSGRVVSEGSSTISVPCMMNTKLYEGLLKKMPHVEKGEFSVAFHLGVPTEGNNGQTLLVSNQMLEAWEIGLEEALDMAVKNPWFLEQCKTISDTEMLRMANQQIAKEWCGLLQIAEPEKEEETGYTIYGKNVSCAAILLNFEFSNIQYNFRKTTLYNDKIC